MDILKTLLDENKKFNVKISMKGKKDINAPIFAKSLGQANEFASDQYSTFVKDGYRVEVSERTLDEKETLNEAAKGGKFWIKQLKSLKMNFFANFSDDLDSDVLTDIEKHFDEIENLIKQI